MSEKYLKLGEKSNSFFDPQTGFGLAKGEIKGIVPAYLKSPRIRRFLKGGGLQYASKEEYNEYVAKSTAKTQVKKTKTLEVEETEKLELEDMTKKQLIVHIEGLGWHEDDIEEAKSKKTKAEIIEFIKETESEYEE